MANPLIIPSSAENRIDSVDHGCDVARRKFADSFRELRAVQGNDEPHISLADYHSTCRNVRRAALLLNSSTSAPTSSRTLFMAAVILSSSCWITKSDKALA